MKLSFADEQARLNIIGEIAFLRQLESNFVVKLKRFSFGKDSSKDDENSIKEEYYILHKDGIF